MEITVGDFTGRYDPVSKMFVMTVPQAVLSHRLQTSDESQTSATGRDRHQQIETLSIRLSPHATWLLGQQVALMAQFGRPFGEEPTRPDGAVN
jgi:hypothetical protein